MYAVIPMAGKGTRMAKYYEGPKQLLPVNGKPVVEHALDALPDIVDKLIFIVGGPHEQKTREHFHAGEYGGRPIEFVVQEEQLGLGHAFKTAKDVVSGSGSWLGMVADDIYVAEDLEDLVQYDLALLAQRVDHPESFGVLVPDEEGYLRHTVEKPKEFISDLVWNGAMVMDDSFFDIEVGVSERGEYETPDIWLKMIQEHGKKIKIVESQFWLPINDKAQLEEAERVMREREQESA